MASYAAMTGSPASTAADYSLGGWANMPPGNPLGGYGGLTAITALPPGPPVMQASTTSWKLLVVGIALIWAVTKHR